MRRSTETGKKATDTTNQFTATDSINGEQLLRLPSRALNWHTQRERTRERGRVGERVSATLSAICGLLLLMRLSAIKLHTQSESKRTHCRSAALSDWHTRSPLSLTELQLCYCLRRRRLHTPLICEARAEAQGKPLIEVDIKTAALG